jgi:hypothetical protein
MEKSVVAPTTLVLAWSECTCTATASHGCNLVLEQQADNNVWDSDNDWSHAVVVDEGGDLSADDGGQWWLTTTEVNF